MSLFKDCMNRLKRAAVIEGNINLSKLIDTCEFVEEGDILAATNGEIVFIGKQFYDYSLPEQYFILNHEFMHIILNHVERGKGLIPDLYNVAADIIINDFLIQKGRKKPSNACTYESAKVPRELKATKEVYDFLLKNNSQASCFTLDLQPDLQTKNEESKEIVQNLVNQIKGDSSIQSLMFSESIISPIQNFEMTVDWFDLLKIELGRLAYRTNLRTYLRPSRVQIKGLLLKGGNINQFIPKINVIIDVSSSMNDMPLKIAGKVKAIKHKLKIFSPSYFWLNTDIGEIKDIKNIPLGGGTDLSKALTLDKCDMNVLLTDCEDHNGMNEINKSHGRFFIITNNANHSFITNHNKKINLIKDF